MRHQIPPFTRETAAEKVRLAEDGWNSRNPEKAAQAYSIDSRWRNRDQFIQGRDEIKSFLTKKWSIEQEYRLIKELFAFDGNCISVRYAYEFSDGNGNWYRAYGNENWVFDESGVMIERHASINDTPINNESRLFHWQQGRRPDDYPSLSELGL